MSDDPEIIPYLKSIDTTKYRAVNPNVRMIYNMLVSDAPNLAIAYCWIYNLVLPFYSLGYRTIRKINRILFR